MYVGWALGFVFLAKPVQGPKRVILSGQTISTKTIWAAESVQEGRQNNARLFSWY